MSVTSSGPAGYEHQYLVAVWLWLELRPGIEALTIEPPGGEDTSFRLRLDQGSRLFEVQGKDRLEPLDLAGLAAILWKFPDRGATDPLLARLDGDPERHLVLTLSGRASDTVQPFVRPWTRGLRAALSRPPEAPGREVARAFHEALRGEIRGDREGQLHKRRSRYALELLDRLDAERLREVLGRVHVFEHLSLAALHERGRRILAERIHVPYAESLELLDPGLRSVAAEQRGTGIDVAPLLERAVVRRRVERVDRAQLPHVDHPEQAALLGELLHRGVLLLTGPSMCGKSHVACTLGGLMQDRGFHARTLRSPAEALQFLADPAAGEDRLVLLEDPFGRWDLRTDADDALEDLERLIRRCSRGRALIVTSQIEVLRQIEARTHRVLPRLAGVQWRDLRADDPTHLYGVWRAHATAIGIDDAVQDQVQRWMAEPARRLEPGQARHLAYALKADEDLITDPERMFGEARTDAAALGRRLGDDRTRLPVLYALAWTTGTDEGPTEQALAHVLQCTGEARPGIAWKHRSGRTIGGPSEERPAPPTWPSGLALDDRARAFLDELEARGYIAWSDERVRFTHPLYEHAVRVPLLQTTRFNRELARESFERAAYGLDPIVGAHALDVLDQIATRTPGLYSSAEILDLGLTAADESLYPAVASAGLALADRTLERVTLAERAKAFPKVVGLASLERAILWEDSGLVWYDPRASLCWEDLQLETEEVRLPDGSDPRDAIRSGRPVPPQVLSRLLPELHGEDWSEVHPRAVLVGLGRPEMELRARAAELLCRFGPEAESELYDRALHDRHPLVVSYAVRGLIRGWKGREALCWTLLERVRPRLGSPSVAFLIAEDLANFRQLNDWDPDWYAGRSTPWTAWAMLTAEVLPHVPVVGRLNAPRLHDAALQALKAVDPELGIPAVGAWLTWIERHLAEGSPPDSWMMSTGELLMAIPGTTPDQRAEIFTRLLEVQGTEQRIVVARDLLLAWGLLDAYERRQLLAFIHADRPDRRWMRGAVLALGDLPPEVTAPLLPTGVPYPPDPAALCAQWDPQTLEDLVRAVHGIGNPAGVTAAAPPWWEDVLSALLRAPDHPTFDLVLEAMLHEQRLIPEISATLPELVEARGPQVLDRALPTLIRLSALDPVFEMVELWQQVVRVAEPRQLEALIDGWRSPIEHLAYFNATGHLLRRVLMPDGATLHDAVVQRRPEDALLFLAAGAAEEQQDARLWTTVLEAMLLRSPDLLPQTWDMVEAMTRRVRPEVPQLLQEIAAVRRLHDEPRARRRDALRAALVHEGWVRLDGTVGKSVGS